MNGFAALDDTLAVLPEGCQSDGGAGRQGRRPGEGLGGGFWLCLADGLGGSRGGAVVPYGRVGLIGGGNG